MMLTPPPPILILNIICILFLELIKTVPGSIVRDADKSSKCQYETLEAHDTLKMQKVCEKIELCNRLLNIVYI